MMINEAREDNIPIARTDRASLKELVSDGMKFDKKGVQLYVPAYRIKYFGKTKTIARYVFAGYTPERPYQYGGRTIRKLKPFYSLGIAEFDLDRQLWPQDEIRFVRFKKDKEGRERYRFLRDRLVPWLGYQLGVEDRDIMEE